MENREVFVYDKKNFCIPVTKAEPLNAIQFIINDFIKKGVTFCIDGKNEQWEIWRHVEENDSDKIKKTGYPQKPKILYINGKEVKDYDIIE